MRLSHWPLSGLRLRTPRLELRLPDPAELDALAELAAGGVHDPDEMPFLVPWTDLPPAERARGVMQFHWSLLAGWTPDDWPLQLCVFLDGAVVGTQSVGATGFPVRREENGMGRTRVRDALVHERRFVLDRADWARHRAVPVEIEGLDACLRDFGPPGPDRTG